VEFPVAAQSPDSFSAFPSSPIFLYPSRDFNPSSCCFLVEYYSFRRRRPTLTDLIFASRRIALEARRYSRNVPQTPPPRILLNVTRWCPGFGFFFVFWFFCCFFFFFFFFWFWFFVHDTPSPQKRFPGIIPGPRDLSSHYFHVFSAGIRAWLGSNWLFPIPFAPRNPHLGNG